MPSVALVKRGGQGDVRTAFQIVVGLKEAASDSYFLVLYQVWFGTSEVLLADEESGFFCRLSL